MKKYLLTLCTAIFFNGAIMAQQDTTETEYRNMQPRSAQDSLSGEDANETPMPNSTESNIPTSDGTDGNNTRNMQDSPDQASAENNDIEVVEDKEGPNHEVVYKYHGELYYVDRDRQELVKADESQLRDSEHKVIVKEPTIGPYDENTRGARRRSGAGRG